MTANHTGKLLQRVYRELLAVQHIEAQRLRRAIVTAEVRLELERLGLPATRPEQE